LLSNTGVQQSLSHRTPLIISVTTTDVTLYYLSSASSIPPGDRVWIRNHGWGAPPLVAQGLQGQVALVPHSYVPLHHHRPGELNKINISVSSLILRVNFTWTRTDQIFTVLDLRLTDTFTYIISSSDLKCSANMHRANKRHLLLKQTYTFYA
jgi:hypothetical protein